MLVYGISRNSGIEEPLCSEGAETQRVDTWAQWGRGEWTDGESSSDVCTQCHLWARWLLRSRCHPHTASPACCPVTAERGPLVGGEGGGPCIVMADLWRCMAETESPLDCKEIQPVLPKGDQSWVFIGRTDWCSSWNSNTLDTSFEGLTH